ncbi:hypothetical protein K7432_003845 [Basidiobolus ranarum]|uniref:F-box domain-containing protein n=1 Tax=Basidiobolus ranarum TaxID=34480 RepID=A0ABR2WZ59_9FUNG
MSLPQLSTEILALIVLHLTNDRQTLHSLLTVNKVFFKVSAPILYKNPFRPWFWPNIVIKGTYEILYLFLASSNLLPELEEILDWGLVEWSPPTAPFTVNYLDYYTEIDYFQWRYAFNRAFYYPGRYSRDVFGFGDIIHILFCKHNAEKIKTLYIPILKVAPYFPIVTRLSSLRRIKFRRVHKDSSNKNIMTIQEAIQFVKTHVETYGDALTEISIPNMRDWHYAGVQSDVKIEDVVNILKRPQVIEVSDSYHFCEHLQPHSTEHLRVFKGPFISDQRRIDDWDSASFFKRCPKLEKIRFTSFRSNSFKWAVERRTLLTASGSESIISVDSKLPPLQDLEMLCRGLDALPIVQDIIYAFRNTIRRITVKDDKPFGQYPKPLCWDWLLPNLVKLHIDGADFTLFFLGSLNVCPSLEELCLISKNDFHDRRIITKFGPILKLPKLRKIRLMHMISYEFNFGSLLYSPLLESLTLFETRSSLPLRPTYWTCTWTWDWYMPRLKVVNLTGESAFLFQFGLLDSCPPLECLILNTRSHRRSLSMDDIPRINLPLPIRSGPVRRARQTDGFRNKVTFGLRGKWKLSRKMLSTLIQRYMLHVTHFDLTDIEGLTALDIIIATQNLPHVVDVRSTACLTNDDILQTGMDVRNVPYYGVGEIGSVKYRMVWPH